MSPEHCLISDFGDCNLPEHSVDSDLVYSLGEAEVQDVCCSALNSPFLELDCLTMVACPVVGADCLLGSENDPFCLEGSIDRQYCPENVDPVVCLEDDVVLLGQAVEIVTNLEMTDLVLSTDLEMFSLLYKKKIGLYFYNE